MTYKYKSESAGRYSQILRLDSIPFSVLFVGISQRLIRGLIRVATIAGIGNVRFFGARDGSGNVVNLTGGISNL
jgi:hypothetical protein